MSQGNKLGKRRPVAVGLVLGLAAFVLFAIRLGQPGALNFDESHYVPAARAILELERNTNPEHPLFAKIMIAGGMYVLGDQPVGWRIASVLAGVICIIGVYGVAMSLLRSVAAAAFAAVLTMANHLVFIHARIAMLDIFMAGFFLLGLAFYFSSMRAEARRTHRMLLAAGVCFGLAMASKWAAIPYVFFVGAGFVFIKVWAAVLAGAGGPLSIGLHRLSNPWPRVSALGGGCLLTIAALATYFATFTPAFFFEQNPLTFSDVISSQFDMLSRQSQRLAAHTYQSDWWQWPYIGRAIWYFYEPIGGVQRGVVLIGNPVIMFGGLVAVAYCLVMGARERSVSLLMCGGLFVLSYVVWPIMPKKIGFYYYYLTPAIMLSFALAGMALDMVRRFPSFWSKAIVGVYGAACLAIFAYFYPIISAMPLDGDYAFLRWAWFDTWR